jgi:hypothetical protein
MHHGSLMTMFYLGQCSEWAGICRKTISELLFVFEFHIGTYQYVLYSFIYIFFFVFF